jgi:opacity protein-like surface antigen
MRLSLRAALPIVLVGLAPFPAALAADYDPPMVIDTPEEYVPVEVGNGWYLRGDIGYKFNTPYRDSVFGPSPIFSYEESSLPLTGSIGFGYRFTDFLRMEANVGLLTSDSSSLNYLTADGMGTVVSNVNVSTENEIWTGMVNAYADLGTFVGFTPYIGAGVGVAATKRNYGFSENFVDGSIVDVAYADNSLQYVFAYSLGAGVNYKLTKNLSVDVGYEYFSAPNAEYVTMVTPTTYAINSGIDYHQIKLGLRYDLW